MTELVLGIDSGSTTIKVAVHDAGGGLMASASSPAPRTHLSPGVLERDPGEHWGAVGRAVRLLFLEARVDPARVVAIGLSGHGDGLQLVADDGAPVGSAILSQDNRAAGIVERWSRDGTLEELRRLTGQVPFPGSPAPLLRWLAENDRDRLSRARWVLATKDWIRLRMTGEIATDRTDAGASFVDLQTQAYSMPALAATDLGLWEHLLPPVLEPTDVAGRLTQDAAAELGLRPGIVVAAGLHDVAATLVGSVGTAPGRLCLIAGTFGVNVVLTAAPVRSEALNTRSGPLPGTWTVRRTARGSGASVEWAARALLGEGGGATAVPRALDLALGSAPGHAPPTFVPFVFGGNGDQPSAGSYLGLRSWHGREDMLRGVVEGVALNHCLDIDVVRAEVAVASVHLAGGLTRDARWNQIVADALDHDITFVRSDGAASRGAAMTAAVAAGFADDLTSAAASFRPDVQRLSPGPRSQEIRRRYRRYRTALRTARTLEDAMGAVDIDVPAPAGPPTAKES